MMILSYIHRQQLKTYVTGVVWPEMDKPIIHFPSAPSSRDEGNFSAAEETDRLLPTQIIKTDHFDTSEKVAEQNDQFDSGVSGSEYSGSGKSLPIYRLGYRLDFRRGSHASSGISSGGNSIKTADTNIHSLMSSNHSGDSMLAKSVRSQNNQKFQLPSPIQKPAFAFADLHLPTVAPDLTVNRLTYVHQEPVTGYSIMDKNFGLTSRPADMDTQMDYVGHGYVENTVFNMNNMPTAFLESFKKLKGFKPAVEQPMDYNNQFDASQSDYMSQYEGYKPISALIPPQDDKSETIVPLASKFSMPVFQSKAVPVSPMSHLMPNFDDDYPISNLIPTKFENSGSSTQASISDYRTDYDDGYHIGMPSIPTKAASGYTGTSGYSTGESMDAPGAKVPNDGYVADDGYNAGLIMNPGGYVCDQAPCSFTPPPAPVQQPQVSGYLPFNRAMQTFGIDESIPDEYLLSSRLAAFQGVPPSQEHMIPVSYVSGYTSDVFMTIPEKKHVPGYVSIEGAQLLQQS